MHQLFPYQYEKIPPIKNPLQNMAITPKLFFEKRYYYAVPIIIEDTNSRRSKWNISFIFSCHSTIVNHFKLVSILKSEHSL